jgi:tol-pal system protein YbgF
MPSATKLFTTAVCLAAISGCVASAVASERGVQSGREGAVRLAQASATDLVLRIDRLEQEIRRLTGVAEELQYRNQQLELQLKRAQGDPEARVREAGPKPLPPVPPVPPSTEPVPPQAAAVDQPPSASGSPSRRSDAFDPTQNPNAPGAPKTLGALPENAGPAAPPAPASAGGSVSEPSYVGAPGARAAGAPLDLSTLSGQAASEPQRPVGLPPAAIGAANAPLPPPPPRNPSATGAQQTVMAPTATPRDEYDLAYGYVLHKDYALAEEAFRVFLKKYPGDRLAADASYWLGETLFQRQHYRDAAESFLTVSTKYDTAGKAPDALFRLAQSLAALGEKDAACATFNEVGRKYPRASVSLKQGVEREQKRVGC